MRPLISILIATYNVEAVLEQCLRSIYAQDSPDWEILIADGASTDGTLAILQRHRDKLAYCHSAPDNGTYDAWNTLLPHARGEWFMFLGADDQLNDSQALRRLAAFCADIPPRVPQLSYVFGITELVAGGAVVERLGTAPLEGDRHRTEDDFTFSHTGLLHHRDLFEVFGPFKTQFRIAGDGHFMLRSAKDPRTRFYHADFVVARMATGGISTGAKSRVQCYREVEQARLLLDLTPVRPDWLRALQRRSAIAYHLSRFGGERAVLLAANAYRLVSGKSLRKGYR